MTTSEPERVRIILVGGPDGAMFHATLQAPPGVFRALAAAVLLSFLAGACRGDDALQPQEAARAIRNSPVFTQRAGSLPGRELVEVLAIRPVGRDTAEAEFTWRDAPSLSGSSTRPIRSSMALFRRSDEGIWALASLYKVD